MKPFGTGHAILSCIDAISGPFAVINADDYYGVHAFQEHFVLFLGNSHETAMLRSRNSLNVHRIREITKILI